MTSTILNTLNILCCLKLSIKDIDISITPYIIKGTKTMRFSKDWEKVEMKLTDMHPNLQNMFANCRPLTDEETNGALNKIIEAVKNKFGAELR